MTKTLYCLVFLATTIAAAEILRNDKPGVKAAVTIQATNNTLVPNVVYIVDAVQCLQEAYSIYDTDEQVAGLWAELFAEKHPGSWDVIVGYTAIYLHADIYVETLVSSGDDDKKGDYDKKDSKGGVLYQIFSAS